MFCMNIHPVLSVATRTSGFSHRGTGAAAFMSGSELTGSGSSGLPASVGCGVKSLITLWICRSGLQISESESEANRNVESTLEMDQIRLDKITLQ